MTLATSMAMTLTRLELYQIAAKLCGTIFEAASPPFKPMIGGAVTKHPLAFDVAEHLAKECRDAGGEARLSDDKAGHAFVYLSGCSFDRGDKL